MQISRSQPAKDCGEGNRKPFLPELFDGFLIRFKEIAVFSPVQFALLLDLDGDERNFMKFPMSFYIFKT